MTQPLITPPVISSTDLYPHLRKLDYGRPDRRAEHAKPQPSPSEQKAAMWAQAMPKGDISRPRRTLADADRALTRQTAAQAPVRVLDAALFHNLLAQCAALSARLEAQDAVIQRLEERLATAENAINGDVA